MKCFVVVLLAIMQATPPVPRKPPNAPTGGSKNVQQQATAKMEATNIALPVKDPDRAQTHEESSSTPPKTDINTPIMIRDVTPVSGWTIAYVILTGLLVGVGAVGIGYAVKTLRAVEGQARSMRYQTTHLRRSVIAGRRGANAAKKSADALINSERAWIMGELGWYEKALHIVDGVSWEKNGTKIASTTVNVKLTCRNDGKSPAWIDDVYGIVEIFTRASHELKQVPTRSSMGKFGPMQPLGPGKEKSRGLDLTCTGRPGPDQFLSVYVIVEYRDIFNERRETYLGYSVQPDGANLYRQDALRERNRNT